MSDEVKIKRSYYANGQMRYEHPYKDGKRHGTRRGWYQDLLGEENGDDHERETA